MSIIVPNTRIYNPNEKFPFEYTQRYGIDRRHWSTQGLICFWLMNASAGNIITDLSGNGKTGTLQGTAPSWRVGQLGSAVDLPGTNEYISFASAIPEIAAGNDFSLSFWFIADTVAAQQQIFANTITAAVSRTTLSLVNDGEIKAGVFTGGATWGDSRASSTALSAGVLYNFVYTYAGVSGSTGKAYLNGVLQSGTDTPFTDSVTGLSIGRRNGNDLFLNAGLEIFSAYNRVLTQSEIVSLFREPLIMFKDPNRMLLGGFEAAAPPTGIPILRRRREGC
ncbi:hypothetical protein LCGC14_0346480 [marine sediment metagenome]|uniref:LamG-like jellyroll fold domain-containing protein n=1 Tax=marine sediment metagenome TaxID=412755 RepID=A0A0F9VZP9_9ZZZZ